MQQVFAPDLESLYTEAKKRKNKGFAVEGEDMLVS